MPIQVKPYGILKKTPEKLIIIPFYNVILVK